MQNISNTVTDTFSTIKPWVQKFTTQSRTTDAKYFSTTKKGEIYELKAELNSDNRQKKKEAVKRVIANMTVGKDVSTLFTDVVSCMQTDNLELKKLVYLYLMNYAKSQQDNAIMAVNTFVKDCVDPNPLIRALAVRTMGCCRVEKITAYLGDPLRKCLKDEDPYVRKTAAICVVNLHDIDDSMVEDGGFLEALKDMLGDSNPMVVANSVAAITEILDSSRPDSPAHEILAFNQQIINKLLTALGECTEWGQIFILDALSNYEPADEGEAQNICERIIPRLSHANAAVVLSSVRVIMKLLELLPAGNEFAAVCSKKLAPPLVTLLSAEPEIQYVALRNVNLIVQKRPEILKHEMKVFFVKYNDPIYVKLEKLDIMIRLTNASNIGQVLSELKEYAKEVDVDFVRKSVRAIGRCAIKVESSAERCVSTLIDLIQTKVNYVVQEAVVVIKDIFRKYPNRYESIIATLCENLDTLDEPEARASMIWIVGEYAERIDNADELLENFLEGFQDENSQVQLQLLTAIVKLFLKRPGDTQELVQNVLHMSTQESDNPDLRDRGYIYWRLLSTDPAAAKAVVLAEKPLISEETDLLEPTLMDELVCHIGSLASVYHKPPNAFVEAKHITRRQLPSRLQGGSGNEGEDKTTLSGVSAQPAVIPNQETLVADLLELDSFPADQRYQTPSPLPADTTSGNMDLLGDGLEDLIMGSVSTVPAPVPPQGSPSNSHTDTLVDIFSNLGGLGSNVQTGGVDFSTINFGGVTDFHLPHEVWLDASRGKGLEIEGTFYRRSADRQICMDMKFTNKALQAMTNFAIQFNKNSFGLIPALPLNVPSPLLPNQTVQVVLPVKTSGAVMKMQPLMTLQIAVRNNVDILYFACTIPLHVLFTEEGNMEKLVFLATWKDIPPANEKQYILKNISLTADECSEKLKASNVFTIAKRNLEGQDLLYQSTRLTNGIWVLAEMKIGPGNSHITLSLKSRTVEIYDAVESVYKAILSPKAT